MLYGVGLLFNQWMYFMLRKYVFLLGINFSACYAFWAYCIVLSVAFYGDLEPGTHNMLKMASMMVLSVPFSHKHVDSAAQVCGSLKSQAFGYFYFS
jgi:hypothetical protein